MQTGAVKNAIEIRAMTHRRSHKSEQGEHYFSTPQKIKHAGWSYRYLRNRVKPVGADAFDINAWYSGPLGRFSAISEADGAERKSK